MGERSSSRRTQPLRAARAAGTGADVPPAVGRGAGLVAAVTAGVAIAVAGLAYSVLAIPLYVLARNDPDGLDRPMIRDAFLRIAAPAGVLAGLAAGAAVGVWYARGGRLPREEAR